MNQKIKRHWLIGIVTALNPYIGYANATEIAMEALVSNQSVYDLVLAKKLLTRAEGQSREPPVCSWADCSTRAVSRSIPAGRRKESGAIVILSRRGW